MVSAHDLSNSHPITQKSKKVSEFLVIKAFVLFVELGGEMYYNLVCTSRYHLPREFLKS